MAASVRNSLVTTQTTSDTGGTKTVLVPSGLADTDILFVWTFLRGGYEVAPVPTTGWSMIVNDVHRAAFEGNNDARCVVWRKVISGAPPASHVFQLRQASDDVNASDFATHVSVAVQLGDTADPEDLISTSLSVSDTATAEASSNVAVILPEVDPSTAANRLVLTGGMFNAGGDGTSTFLTVSGLTLVAQGSASTSVAGAVYSKAITTGTIEGNWTADIDQTAPRTGRFAAATVLVNSAAVPDPVASAGVNQTVAPGQLVTLDATGSTGTGVLTYAWTKVSGTGTPILSSTTSASPTFHAPTGPDTIVMQVAVTGDLGTRNDTVSIAISSASAGLPVKVRDTGVWI